VGSITERIDSTGLARFGLVTLFKRGTAEPGKARLGRARQGAVWLGWVWQGMARCGTVTSVPRARQRDPASQTFVQHAAADSSLAAPILGALGGGGINSSFSDHYQDVAQGHFTVRRLERKYCQIAFALSMRLDSVSPSAAWSAGRLRFFSLRPSSA
jgi:hypothetical protein